MWFYAYHVLHNTSLLLRPLTLMSRCHLPVFRYCSLKRRESSPDGTFWRMWVARALSLSFFFYRIGAWHRKNIFLDEENLPLNYVVFPPLVWNSRRKKSLPATSPVGIFLKGICEIFVTALIFGPQQQLSAALVHLPSISLTATISELLKPLQYLLQKAWEASGAT